MTGCSDGSDFETPIAVVIATRDRGAKVVAAIESVLASDQSDFELVVVDQSLNDDTEDAVRPLLVDSRVRFVRTNETGVSRSRNLGISLTSAEVIAITDDDCVVPPNWLSKLAQLFADHPRVGVAFCTVRAAPADRPGLTPAITFVADRMIDDLATAWKLSVEGLSLGAGMAVRRTTFDRIHGFDEVLGPGARFGACEDNDFSWRAIIAGWTTYQHSGIAVLHDGFRDLDELRALIIRDFYGVGGAIAKYVRAGDLGIGWFALGWIVRFGVVDPGRELLAGRRPRGLRRPYMLLRGMCAGLITPMNREHRMYALDSHRA